MTVARLKSALLAAAVAAVLALVAAAGGTLNPKIVEEEGFSVIGIEARTSNAREMTGDGVIVKQWARLFKEGLLQKIPNRADSNIVAVYTAYASDKDGEYTYLLGAKVSDASTVPEGMVVKQVPKSRYALLTADSGPVRQVVPAAWRAIWDLDDHGKLGGRRAYQADYEVYDQRSRDPQDSQVDIYVGLK